MRYNTKQTLKIYWQHAGKYKISVFLMLFCTLGLAVTNVLPAIYFRDFFNVLAGADADISAAADKLIGILVIIAIIELGHWFFWRVETFSSIHFESRMIADLNNTCFQYLHKHSFGFFTNNFVGSLVKRVNRFTRSFEMIADKFIYNLAPLFLNIAIILYVLARANMKLAAVLLAWVLLFIFFNWLFVRYKLKYDMARSEADTKVTGLLADTITNNANVKLFDAFDRESRRFFSATDEARVLRKLTWDMNNYFEAVQAFLIVILEIGLFYGAILLWKKGLLTVGDFALIQSYILIVILKIWDFGRTMQHFYEDLADAEEMTVILKTPHEIVDIPKAKKLIVKKGGIKFENVTFCYNATREVLSDLNLEVRPDEKVAFIGPSGAGKTTIVKLLLRMYELSGGKILIDGQNISKVTQESLWRVVSMVPQDPILFHRSLLENIRYGRPEATEKEVVAAAKLAYCHEFIKSFPDGYGTFVGERGIKLSGGERQRVAIARAILRDSPILVLDEATSSLDSESEKLIQDALANLMKNKTVLVIAHRLSTIMKMDRIVVIDGGKIVEQGTHAELLATGGIYSKLWNLQAGGFIK